MTNSHDDDDDCVFCSGGSGQRLQVQHIQEAYRRMRCEGKHAHTLSTLHKPHTTHCIITHHTSHITQHTTHTSNNTQHTLSQRNSSCSLASRHNLTSSQHDPYSNITSTGKVTGKCKETAIPCPLTKNRLFQNVRRSLTYPNTSIHSTYHLDTLTPSTHSTYHHDIP